MKEWRTQQESRRVPFFKTRFLREAAGQPEVILVL